MPGCTATYSRKHNLNNHLVACHRKCLGSTHPDHLIYLSLLPAVRTRCANEDERKTRARQAQYRFRAKKNPLDQSSPCAFSTVPRAPDIDIPEPLEPVSQALSMVRLQNTLCKAVPRIGLVSPLHVALLSRLDDAVANLNNHDENLPNRCAGAVTVFLQYLYSRESRTSVAAYSLESLSQLPSHASPALLKEMRLAKSAWTMTNWNDQLSPVSIRRLLGRDLARFGREIVEFYKTITPHWIQYLKWQQRDIKIDLDPDKMENCLQLLNPVFFVSTIEDVFVAVEQFVVLHEELRLAEVGPPQVVPENCKTDSY